MATPVQSQDDIQDSSASIVIVLGSNVTAGNLLTVCASRYVSGSTTDGFVAGDLTKTAGTATIGPVVLDASGIRAAIAGSDGVAGAIYSIPITGSGSLTLTLNCGNAGDYFWVTTVEWPSTLSAAVEDTAGSSGSSTAPNSGDATSADDAVFLALLAFDSADTVSVTEDGAFTLLYENEVGGVSQVGATAYRSVTSGTTDAATWTLGGSRPWVSLVAVYTESGGGGGGGGDAQMGGYFAARPIRPRSFAPGLAR